jgi:hypothetical protein
MPVIVVLCILAAAYLLVGCAFVRLCEVDARWQDTWLAVLVMLVFWLPWVVVVAMLDWMQERKV